jgi:hypothetical protein
MVKRYETGTVSSRTLERLVEVAKAYLVGRRWINFSLMLAVVNTFYPHVPAAIRGRRCPFCGKAFKTRSATRSHIARVHREELNTVAMDCAEKYMRLADNIVKYSLRTNGLRVNVVKLRGLDKTFTSKDQLVDYLIKNPDIVRAIVG